MTEHKMIKQLDSFYNLLNSHSVNLVFSKVSNWAYQDGLYTEFKNTLLKESGIKNNTQKLRFAINDLEETISQNVVLL